MNNMPLVSVCTLAYNHAPYIRECLDGILMQKTNFAFELLIHDDASTDGTADIIREYEAKYPDIVKPIYQTENQYSKGVKISSTYQFPRAKGKYIAMCEGDDYWTDPLKLQKQVDFMEANPEYSLCFHNAKVIYQDEDKESHIFANIEDREYRGEELINKFLIPTASALFTEKAKNEYISRAYNPNYSYADLVIWLSCYEVGKIRGINENMSIYRRNKGSVSYYPRANDIRMKQVIEFSNDFNSKYWEYVKDEIAEYYILMGISKIFYEKKISGFKLIFKGLRITTKPLFKFIKSKLI